MASHIGDIISRVMDKDGEEKFPGEWELVQSTTDAMLIELAALADAEQDPALKKQHLAALESMTSDFAAMHLNKSATDGDLDALRRQHGAQVGGGKSVSLKVDPNLCTNAELKAEYNGFEAQRQKLKNSKRGKSGQETMCPRQDISSFLKGHRFDLLCVFVRFRHMPGGLPGGLPRGEPGLVQS